MTGNNDDPFYQPWNDGDDAAGGGAAPKRRYPQTSEGLKKPEDPPLGIKLSDYVPHDAAAGAGSTSSQLPSGTPSGESAKEALKEAGIQAGKAAKAMAAAAKSGAGKAGAAIARMELGAKFRAGAKITGEKLGAAGAATAVGLERTAASIGRGATAAGKSAAEASKSAYDNASEKLGPKLADAAEATQNATRKFAQDAKSSVQRGADAIKAKATPEIAVRPTSALDDLIEKEGLDPIIVDTRPGPAALTGTLSTPPETAPMPAVDTDMPLFGSQPVAVFAADVSKLSPNSAPSLHAVATTVPSPGVDGSVLHRSHGPETVSARIDTSASDHPDSATVYTRTASASLGMAVPKIALPGLMRPTWLSAPMAWGNAIALGIAAIFWLGTMWQASRTDAAIRNYLLTNPEIIPQAINAYQAKEQAKTVVRLREPLESAFSGAWMGNPDGDVTLVIFSDYACTYCRQSTPVINRLLKEDKGLKIVYRELPILSAKSEVAARQALAIAKQGRYAAFHNSVMDAPAMTDASVAAGAKASGADLAKVAEMAKSDAITQELNRNVQLARELGFTGTPSWIIGDQAMTGAVGYAALKKAVAKARGS